MATQPKRWPNHAAWARDDAASFIQQSVRSLKPLLDHQDPIVVARVASSLYQATNALRLLEAVGAATLPDLDGPSRAG